MEPGEGPKAFLLIGVNCRDRPQADPWGWSFQGPVRDWGLL